MPRFTYKAIGPDGSLVSDHVEAESEVAALDRIAGRGLTPTSITEGGDAGPWWTREVRWGRTASAPPAELERFFDAFSTLLGSQLPLVRTLAFCKAQARDRRMAAALTRVQDAVENGRSLGAAMGDEGAVIPERFATLITLGERSNRLSEIAARVAETLRSEAAIRRELQGAMTYPLILLTMSALVLALLVFYLAPTLLPVFATAGAAPPTALALMVGLRDLVLSGWPVLLAAIGGIAVAGLVLRGPIRASSSRLALRLPVAGVWIRQRETMTLAQTLALLLRSGATLQTALRTAATTTSHPAYRRLIEDAEAVLSSGGTLSQALRESPLIDGAAQSLVEAGEESDRLVDMLETASRMLKARSTDTLARAMRLVTPVLTLLIGAGVGALILSTVTAILDLNDVAF